MSNPRLVLIFCFIIFTRLNSEQWRQTNGPCGNTVFSIFSHGDILFAGTGYGVYRSSDGGKNWVAANNGLPVSEQTPRNPISALSVADVYSFATDGGVLYAGTDFAGVCISEDSGSTWRTGTAINSFTAKAMITYKNNLIAALTKNICYSMDSGATWDTACAVNGPCAFAICDTIIFAATGDGILLSNDHGITWSLAGLEEQVVHDLAMSDATIWAATSDSVFFSADTGRTWKSCNRGLPGNSRINAIDADNSLYALVKNKLYRLDNVNALWTPATGDSLESRVVYSLIKTGNKFYAGTERGVLCMDEEFGNWQKSDSGMVNTSISALYARNDTLYAGNSIGGVFRTSDYGETWIDISANLGNGAVLAINTKKNIIIAAHSSNISISRDYGQSWIASNLPHSLYHCIATAPDGDIFVGCAGVIVHGILRSTDNGCTWMHADSGMPIIGAGPDSSKSKSTVFNLDYNNGCLYAATYHGLFRSCDNGGFWYRFTTERYSDHLGRDVKVIGSKIFLAKYSGVMRSDTNYIPYCEMSRISDFDSVECLEAVGTSLFAGTLFDGVFLSHDYGDSWQQLDAGWPENGFVRSLAASDGYLFAGLWRQGVWRYPLDGILAPKNPNAKQQSYAALPFQCSLAGNTLRQSFSTTHTQNVSIAIYNILGRQKKLLLHRRLPAGGHHFSWNLADLAPGFYTVRMRIGEEERAWKLLVQF
jgi:photosystem II stability/assembly factor-like uncharacterized protein